MLSAKIYTLRCAARVAHSHERRRRLSSSRRATSRCRLLITSILLRRFVNRSAKQQRENGGEKETETPLFRPPDPYDFHISYAAGFELTRLRGAGCAVAAAIPRDVRPRRARHESGVAGWEDSQ